MANLDIAERRLSQDGRITYKTGGRTLDLRVSTIATIFGEKVVVRVFDQECIAQYDLKKLGFDGKNLMLFNKFLNYSCGMVLVTGPTGSGKSTTLYTAMRILNSLEKNLVTVEDPVEYQLPGVNQTQVNAKAGVTFATYLRSIVRQDPDVIMVGEIRDLETAQMAVRAASTGHLVLSTLHTNDASGSLSRLVDMGIEPVMVASSVLGVVTQRLVRRICLACREPYYPDEQELAFAGITGEQGQFLTGGGCELCNRTGYRGRVAISEVLAVTPKLRSLIIARAASEVLREVALQEGMVPIETDGVRKALQGITTIKEVMRATFR
jgi:type IV pilus assembly protein PilB